MHYLEGFINVILMVAMAEMPEVRLKINLVIQ